MRTEWDVIRSLQRYVASMLLDPWDVRVSLENEAPQRPYVLVTQNGPSLPVGTFGAHSLRKQIAVTVHAYLEEGADRMSAEMAAAGIEETLFVGFKVQGVAPATRGDVVPLWDFVDDTTGGANPPRQAPDYATISAFASRSLPDATSPRRMIVVTDMRLSWWRAGSTPDSGGLPWTGGVKATQRGSSV